MNEQNSILDKIIESQEKQQAASFNPNELIVNLLKSLSSKEGDILARRFGLLGKQKETLEQIGKYYNITRERIRQIEMATVKKIKELKNFKQEIEAAEHHITHLLENYGGVMEHNFILNEIGSADDDQNHYQATQFILERLLNDRIESIKPDEDLLAGWRLPTVPIDLVKQVVKELVGIIEQEKKLLTIQELLSNFQQRDFYKDYEQKIISLKLGADKERLAQEIDKLVGSYLKISKRADQNILGEWGLNSWHTVIPKRMSDKIYLVLRKIQKPLHFTEITNSINQVNFDKKTAYPATIHNELILDDRYVLVGRGIYALKEWGYKPGTVIDIILGILNQATEPLSKEEIVKRVLEQRLVRKSTIYLALTNKEKIKKLDEGKYTLNQ